MELLQDYTGIIMGLNFNHISILKRSHQDHGMASILCEKSEK